jgi:hypothetical protein
MHENRPAPSGDEPFRALVGQVAAFYITDKAMKQAQQRAASALEAGCVDAGLRAAYVAAVRRYFAGFEREARAHLRTVDKRLEHANQVQFNLTAERGVAVRRIEATQAVLTELKRVEDAQAG